jgi:hypothetical protein
MTEETMEEGVVVALNALKARHSPPEKDPNKQYPYRLIPFEELRPGCASPYIVDGLIPIDGLVAAWGPPKCGKSFWVFDLVMHIALGWEYRGRRVKQGPVVYCAFEGAQGFNDRAEAFRRTHTEALDRRSAFLREWEIPEEIWFHLLASSAKLVRDHSALIQSIDGQTDRPPTVVVLDTLNRSIDGSESKDQDMGAYLAAAEAICDAFACVVIIVHHCGIDSSRPRGHTSLAGAVNVQIAIQRDAAGNVVAEVEAMKDGLEGARFTSRLEVIEVGTNDVGKPITSCAIVPSDAVVVVRGPKLTKTQNLAYDALKRTIRDDGVEVKAGSEMAKRGVPVGTRACLAETWRQQFYNLHDAKKPATKRQALFRATLDLEAAKLLVLAGKGEYVYLLGQA